MTDNLPLLFWHFSRFEVVCGLLLSPKEQTSNGSEHPGFPLSSLAPFVDLQTQTMKALAKGHSHVHNPEYNLRVMPKDSFFHIII